MSIEIFNLISPFALCVFGALLSIVIYMFKKAMERIRELERNQSRFVTRADAREMVEDKVSPINQQLERVEEKLDKIIDIMIKLK